MINAVKASFAERLAVSRLLTAEQLESAQQEFPDDESGLGDYLVDQELLTPFQLRQLRNGATSFLVGKYVVLDCLGRGGNGIVYKARHTLMPNRFVAIKTLDTQSLHHNDEAMTRFKREIEIVAQLEHPNVVRAYDVLQTRTQLYLVLEYVPGKDLGVVVKERGPLPIAEAVDYGLQAARGLEYAHERGIIHRDLKPANLLLTPTGLVKLTDLGLARMHLDHEAELTMQGRCLGTPEFMAPEQAEDASKADHKSDLYALGSTLFHLLTAQLPVKGTSYLHALQQLLMVAPRPLAQARPDVPAELASIVDRLRARDPGLRPASAADVIRLLEPFALSVEDNDLPFWDGRRKAALVLDILQGQITADDACRENGLDPAELESWQQRVLQAAESAFDQGDDDHDDLIRELHAQIGAQAMEIQGLKRRLGER